MQQGSDPANLPTRIARDAQHRQLHIPWADGHRSVYDWEYLRWRCPCAFCRGEWGQPGQLDRVRSLTPEQTELRSMEHVGRYAVKIVWADGHDTGLYAFRDLRAICPCSECQGGNPH